MRNLVSLIMLILLVSCGGKKNPISGVYENTAESDYSVANTTLTIEKASKESKDLYTIKKDVEFALKNGKTKSGKDSLGKFKKKPTEFLSGHYDADNQALTIGGYEDPYVLVEDGTELKFKGLSYKKR